MKSGYNHNYKVPWASGAGVSRRAFLLGGLAVGAAWVMGRWVRAEDALAVAPVPSSTPDPDPVFPANPPLNELDTDLFVERRIAWSAYAPRLTQMASATAFFRITVHHAGNQTNTHVRRGQVIEDLNGILDAHLQKNYGDIAYHFMIDYGGGVWEGRSLAFEGAHVAGRNEGNLGVMLLGNFEHQKPAANQIAALFLLVDALRRLYEVPGAAVYGHCDLAHSLCPGRNLYAPYLSALRKWPLDQEAPARSLAALAGRTLTRG